MSLNWIVPGRRAVVTAQIEYSNVISEWAAALRETTLRDKLLEWYAPISRLEPSVMQSTLEMVMQDIDWWSESFFAEADRDSEHAYATEDTATIDRAGWWLRLWKGPYRVLKEHAANLVYDAAEPAAVPRELQEVEASVPLRLRLDAHRRVRNHDAVFVPGDVIELPIFRVMERCGVRSFAGAHFNGRGSCFLGTSVVDGAGQSPGRLRIHDNLLAMRFQLLLNAARGSFNSLDSGYNHGADNERKSNNVEVEGETVYSRGIIYGGSLGNITRLADEVRGGRRDPQPNPNPAYLLSDRNWGEGGRNTPVRSSLAQFRTGTRLTTAWSCTPCAISLARFLCLDQQRTGGGGVNQNFRKASAPQTLLSAGELHYLTPAMYPAGGASRSDTLRFVYSRAEGPGVPNVAWLRERALRRLLRDRVRRQISEQEHEAETDRIQEEMELADGEGEEYDPDTAPPPPTPVPAPDPEPIAVDYDPEAVEEEADDEDAEEEVAVVDEEVEWNALLPPGEEIELTRDEQLEFFSGAVNAVGLNGHEYSYVRIYEHDRLLQEPARDEGPPLAGSIAAYNPLNGQSYYQAPDDRGDLYIFEGTGLMMPVGIVSPSFTAFDVRPTRWTRVESIYLQADRHGKLKIGEGAVVGLTGNQQGGGHTRRKGLISVVTFDEQILRDRHEVVRAHRYLLMQPNASTPLADKAREHDYPDRAVPFSTLDESSADEQFITLGVAGRNRDDIADRFPSTRVIDAALTRSSRFERQLAYQMRVLQAETNRALRSARQVVARRRREFDRRYPPDAGRTHEQPVEQRQSFRDALTRFRAERARPQAELDRALQAYNTAHANWRAAVANAGRRERADKYRIRQEAHARLRAARRGMRGLPGGREFGLQQAAARVRENEQRLAAGNWRARARTKLIQANRKRYRDIRRALG